MRRTAGFAALAAPPFATTAHAETMTPEQMVAVIQKLQSRVDALETRSRQDRAEATAAKAELLAIQADRRARRGRPLLPAPASYAVAPAAAPVALISKDGPALIPVTAPVSSFDGFYAAAFGGYQFGTDRQRTNGVFSFANINAVKGGNVGAAVGYNITSGSLLFGLEGRVRKEFDETVARGDSGIFGVALPRQTFSSCCFATPGIRPLRPIEVQDFELVSQTKVRSAIKREYGADVSARIGAIFGASLVYMRLGAGFNLISDRYVTDRRGTVTCIQPVGYAEASASGAEQGFITGCTSLANGSLTRSVKDQAQPYGIIGLGFEHNFGPYFARIEGAVMSHLPPGSGPLFLGTYYTTEATGAVGVRF